ADIDAQLADDDTAAGRRHAAAVRASLPDVASKEATWATVMHDTELHNAELGAMIAGFHQANQVELLSPYTTRYFDEIGEVWGSRTSDTARTIAEGMVPFLAIDQSTVDL